MKKNKRKNFRHTEESKKKISQANMGRVTTDETRKKLSDSKKGKPRPD